MSVHQRDVLPMFEVFTLGIHTIEEMEAQLEAWKSPFQSDEIPESMRALLLAKPKMPKPPATFEVWPFESWRTQALRRAEFIVENVSESRAIGNNPNAQSAAKPMAVPPEAAASCVVSVGILFTGAKGERLLIGVDWMPFNMLVTQDATLIGAYLDSCELIDLSTYLEGGFEG